MTNSIESADLVVDEWDADAPIVLDPGDKVFETYLNKDGNALPIKCANCALWNHPLAVFDNKPMCFADRKVELEDGAVVQRMHEDVWSCGLYFVPQESALLLNLLPKTKDHIWVINHGERFLNALIRFRLKIGKKTSGTIETLIETDAFQYGLLLAQQHYTNNSLKYTLPFLQLVASAVKQKLKTTRNKIKTVRSARFVPGDLVTWMDPKTGQEMSGWFQCIGKRDSSVTLVLSTETRAAMADANAPTMVKYSLAAWRENSNPVIKNRAVLKDSSLC